MQNKPELKIVSDNTPECQYCGIKLRTRIVEVPKLGKKMSVLEYPCKCLDKEDIEKVKKMSFEAKLKRFDSLFAGSMMPKRFKNISFGGSDKNRDKINFEKALHYAKCFDPESGNGAMFFGTMGRGKTHLMACIANYLMEHGYSVYFTTYYELAEQYFKDSEIMKTVLKADFVILDELGTCKMTEYSNDILRRVINSLYQEEKCIGITINPDILSRLTRAEYLGPAHDRLQEMLTVRLEFKGESLRGK